jgi:hypothetical protein
MIAAAGIRERAVVIVVAPVVTLSVCGAADTDADAWSF